MNFPAILWALIEYYTPLIITALSWVAGGLVIALVWVALAFLMARFCATNERPVAPPVMKRGPGRRVQGNAHLIEQESTPV